MLFVAGMLVNDALFLTIWDDQAVQHFRVWEFDLGLDPDGSAGMPEGRVGAVSATIHWTMHSRLLLSGA